MSAPTPSKNPAFRPVRLQHVMREVRRPVFVKPEARYREIGVRSHGRGVFHKELVSGADLGNKRVFWLKPGTLVFNIVFAWERAVAVLSDDEAGLIASHRFPMYEMVPGWADARFMKHYFTTGYGHYLLRLNSPGAAGRNKTLNQSALMKEEVWLPPAETQRAIADFLDRKTAAIDALIRKKERLLGLLAEQRAALIHRAVTRGLHPEVEMKDSGVEWIGEVPAHWAVKRLKLLIKPGTSISYGIVQPGPHVEEGVPFVQTTDISKTPLPTEGLQRTTREIEAHYPRSRVRTGELILGIRASIGAVHVVPAALDGANLSRGVARIVPGEGVVTRYLRDFIASRCAEEYWQRFKQGSTFNEIPIGLVRELPVALPPLEEQLHVSDWLESQVGRSRRVVRLVQSQLDRLREYRQALITAAVTGQLDLSSEAAA